MPDGVTHHKYFKKGYWAIVPVSLAISLLNLQLGSGILIGYSAGRYVDPDWDILGANSGEGRMINELPIIGHLLFGISSTYGSIFRKFHRKPITHFPFLSTAIRWWFVMLLPYLITGKLGYEFFLGVEWFWMGTWVGLSIADGIHWWLDKNYKEI